MFQHTLKIRICEMVEHYKPCDVLKTVIRVLKLKVVTVLYQFQGHQIELQPLSILPKP